MLFGSAPDIVKSSTVTLLLSVIPGLPDLEYYEVSGIFTTVTGVFALGLFPQNTNTQPR